MVDVTPRPGMIFRDQAIQRYATNRRRDEPLRDVSARLIMGLWIGSGVLACTLLAVTVYVAALIR
jgi:hypothetical protein